VVERAVFGLRSGGVSAVKAINAFGIALDGACDDGDGTALRALPRE
jgi:hypothetical protein